MSKAGTWIVVGATVLLFCSQFAAADDALGISVRPRGGVMYPTDPDWKDVFDSFYQAGVAVRKSWGRFGLETSIDYFGAVDEWEFSETVDDIHVSADLDAWMIPWKLTAIANLKPRKPDETGFNAYVGGGVGLWFYSLDGRASAEGYGSISDSEEGVEAGLHAILGAEYYFSQRIGIYAEGGYNWMEASEVGDINMGGLSVAGGLSIRF